MDKDSMIDWRLIQTLVRSMPDLHKTLILAHVTKKRDENCYDTRSDVDDAYSITEIAIASEHAPFRHKKMIREAGTQVKKKRKGDM